MSKLELDSTSTHNHYDINNDSSWEANRINILQSQVRIEKYQDIFAVNVKEVSTKLSDIAEKVSALDSKFDRYNGFNDKILKQDAKIEALNDTVTGLVVKLSWLVSLIAAIASIAGNYVLQFFGKGVG